MSALQVDTLVSEVRGEIIAQGFQEPSIVALRQLKHSVFSPFSFLLEFKRPVGEYDVTLRIELTLEIHWKHPLCESKQMSILLKIKLFEIILTISITQF